jgi:CRP/FNR family transcriptional regulator, cyclic AMP receptor protein
MASPIFKHLSVTPTAFAAGETLIAEADAAPPLYVLDRGTLEIFRNAVLVASISEPGAVVGEMAALLGRPATATVRAKGPVSAYRVADPEKFFEKSPAVLLKIARTLAHRLDATTAFLVESRHRFAETQDMQFIDDVFALLSASSHAEGKIDPVDRS